MFKVFDKNINYSNEFIKYKYSNQVKNLLKICYENNYMFRKNIIKDVFITSCKHGHIEIVKWLYSLGNVDIHVYYEEVFRYACKSGNIEIAKWIHSIDPEQIHYQNIKKQTGLLITPFSKFYLENKPKVPITNREYIQERVDYFYNQLINDTNDIPYLNILHIAKINNEYF